MTRGTQNQRGSALLIVFVFTAILAISLYAELPVTLFEAKRQKEQLLVDRGHEYVRAIQLFYRANHGQFPASIDQLMSTNNRRYLRRRYKDPFTGKDDWRLLHAGAGGILVDSKVAPMGIPGVGGQGAQSLGAGFKSASDVASASSASSSESDGDATVVAPVAQRPPAVSATGGGAPSTSGGAANGNGDAPLLPSASEMEASVNGQTPGVTGTAAAGANGVAQTGTGSNVMQTVGSLLNNPTGQQQSNGQQVGTLGAQPGANGGGFGQLNGGGALAGVASKAKGHSIKLVAEQSDYSLWEFHYDPTKDLGLGGMMMGAPGVNGLQGAPGVALPGGTPASGVGISTPIDNSSGAGPSNNGVNAPGFNQNGTNQNGTNQNGANPNGTGAVSPTATTPGNPY